MNKSSFSSNRGPAVNKSISAKSVRVITDNGEMLGVLQIEEALKIASDQGLDLVEVSPKANPPVCKIIDIHVPFVSNTQQWSLFIGVLHASTLHMIYCYKMLHTKLMDAWQPKKDHQKSMIKG